ncbi:MAG: zf-HC2 domain-containing protein [Chloroflexota bacterium]|nr:zf-HC2 domain-containing protein [Chloroflexota bacterium]
MVKTDRDRHLTTEELSAFLDRRLSPTEQEACKAHLESCQQCQRALASLQQTVALLRAMPQPTAPRSFTLSPGVTYLQEPATRPVEPTKPATRRRWPYYAQRSLRALSTIAAVIGFIFLLSGLLPLLIHGGAGITSSTNSASPSGSNPNTQATHSTATLNPEHQATANAVKPAPTPGTSPTSGTPHTSITPHTSQPGSTPAVAVKTPQAQHSNDTQKQIQAPPIIDLNIPLARQELGLALLIIGIIGILITRRRSAKRT